MRFFQRAILSFFLLAWAGSAMADCTYRPWDGVVTPFASRTYADVASTTITYGATTATFPYNATILNDLNAYRGVAVADPPSTNGYKFMRKPFFVANDGVSREVITQWREMKHTVRPAEAVIMIHGNSMIPDGWDSTSAISQGFADVPYTNHAGSQIKALGFDVFTPYVTHESRFQVAGTRVAAAYGDSQWRINIERLVNLFRSEADNYDRIHIVGPSWGGFLTVMLARELAGEAKLGMALSIEGWIAHQHYVESDQAALFAWNWEQSFARKITIGEFMKISPTTYLAYGSCNAAEYEADHLRFPERQRIFYDGGHEVLIDTFNEALTRYRGGEEAEVLPINDQYTKVFLPLTTGLTDSNAGGSSHAWTANGSAAVSNGWLNLGPNGPTDYITTPSHADFALGSQEFTLEADYRPGSLTNEPTSGLNIINRRGVSDNFSWGLCRWNGTWRFIYSLNGTSWNALSWTSSISAGTTYKLKITRTSDAVELTVNETSLGSQNLPTGAVFFASAAPLRIGFDGATLGGAAGSVRNVGLSVGIAR